MNDVKIKRELIFQGLQSDGWLAWVGVVLVAAVLIFLLMRMERKLVSGFVGWTMLILRFTVLATLFLTMMQPVLTWSLDRTTQSNILVALDLSESMSTADKQASQSEKLRWARALGMYGNAATQDRIDRWLKAFEEGREPEWVDPNETQDPIRRSELAATRKENLEGVFAELGRLTRSEIALRLLTKTTNPLLKQLEDVANVKVVVFAKDIEETDEVGLRGYVNEPPDSLIASQSDLTSPMLSGEDPLSGVVLLTDGRDNSERNPLNIANQLGILDAPVCPVALGSVFRPRDLSIGSVDYPQTLFLNDKAVLSAEILAFGFENEEVTVLLEKDGQVVEEKQITTVEGGSNVDFNLNTSEVGRQKYSVRVKPQDGETRDDNNESSFALTVVDDRARVLLVEGESRWEFRFLHRALDRDERVIAKSVVFEQPYIEQLNTSFFASELNVPGDAEKIDESPLAEVDLVIIGDVSPEKLTDDFLLLLDRYVSELGGTVLFQAGKRFMPMAHDNELLSKLLPIQSAEEVNLKGRDQIGPPRERGMHLYVTAEALDETMFQFVEERFANRKFWLSLPGHSWGIVSEVKAGATVFACVADAAKQQDLDYERKHAVIAHQFYGFGQVMWLGIDSTWRWRFREGDRYHHRFWGQVARWAASNKASAGNEEVRLKLSATELQMGEDLNVTALWSGQTIMRNPNTRGTAIVRKVDENGNVSDEVFASVELVPDEGRTRSHSAKILAPPAGAFRVELMIDGQQPEEAIIADFYVQEEKSLELSDVSCNRQLLQQIAEASGGRVFNADEVDQIVEMFSSKDQTKTKTIETPLWDHWSMMILFFFLLTLEWLIRKLNGLP